MKETEICKIKLEVFTLVEIDNNILEASKKIIEKLDKHEEVLKVHVNKFETNMDVNKFKMEQC